MSRVHIAPTNTMAEMNAAMDAAADYARSGQPIALPTETVYGLAANGLNPTAIERVFKIKGRPPTNPLILHVNGSRMAQTLCQTWTHEAEILARAFWPGPLTFVLKKSSIVPPIVTAQADTVAIRCPDHPVMRGVIDRLQKPLAAPSANPSNQLSPTRAEHVAQQLGDQIPLVVDAGPCRFGIESTVIDLTISPPAILRPGHISREVIEKATGWRLQEPTAGASAKSPGQLKRHYSPKAALRLARWSSTEDLIGVIQSIGGAPARTAVIAYDQVPDNSIFGEVIVFPEDPEAYARALYHELFQIDQRGLKFIAVERPPDTPEWAAVLDRLTRAQAAD